jgi:hypothetical protein
MLYAIIITLGGATATGPFDTLAECNARMVPSVEWLMKNAPNSAPRGACVPAPIAGDMLAAQWCKLTATTDDTNTYACARREF